MGILSRPAHLVETLLAWQLPRGFSVVELGNQFYRANGAKEPAQAWYERLGCSRYVTIDGNGDASIMADLNYPLNVDEIGTFDLVTDFGTGEHVFNQAQAWNTLHDLCKVGGYIIFDRPKQGWDDHCFYNVHETLIRDLAEANGYRIGHLEAHTIEGHGELLFGILQKVTAESFRYPQQGKYRARLQSIAQAPRKRLKRGDVLLHLTKKHGWTKGAEIGVYNGEQCFFKLLDNCPDLTMIAVDRWSSTDKDYGDLTKVGEEFRAKAEAYGDRSIVLQGRTVDMAHDVADGSVDFCFIDASHDYDSVKADIAAWVPKVRKGGAVMGHDIDHESVRKAVIEAFGPDRVAVLPDDVWAVEAA